MGSCMSSSKPARQSGGSKSKKHHHHHSQDLHRKKHSHYDHATKMPSMAPPVRKDLRQDTHHQRDDDAIELQPRGQPARPVYCLPDGKFQEQSRPKQSWLLQNASSSNVKIPGDPKMTEYLKDLGYIPRLELNGVKRALKLDAGQLKEYRLVFNHISKQDAWLGFFQSPESTRTLVLCDRYDWHASNMMSSIATEATAACSVKPNESRNGRDAFVLNYLVDQVNPSWSSAGNRTRYMVLNLLGQLLSQVGSKTWLPLQLPERWHDLIRLFEDSVIKCLQAGPIVCVIANLQIHVREGFDKGKELHQAQALMHLLAKLASPNRKGYHPADHDFRVMVAVCWEFDSGLGFWADDDWKGGIVEVPVGLLPRHKCTEAPPYIADFEGGLTGRRPRKYLPSKGVVSR